MIKTFAVLAFSALLASSAYAGGLKTQFGAGGAGGLTWNGSGANSLSGTTQFGNAASGASTQSYGQSEATFQGGYGTVGNSGNVKSGFGGDVYSNSGSQSAAGTAASGNGFGSAFTGGSGWGAGLSIGGAGALSYK